MTWFIINSKILHSNILKSIMDRKRVENRTSTRQIAQLPVSLKGLVWEQMQAKTLNMSEGGAYCNINHFIAPMTKMMVTLVLPLHKKNDDIHEETIRCEAVVVHINPEEESRSTKNYEVGLWFSDLKNGDKKKIKRYLENTV